MESVRDVLYQTIESHLIWGGTHSSIVNSSIIGAIKHKSSASDFSQSGNDVLFVKENDFTPVVDGITKAETISFKYFNTEPTRTYD
ncbi:hypothetical protein ACI3QN_12610, partial [Propionibacterium freudenreichii]|uniref:hypothetical protein n=1 Tax=Propionibacterium freudenreichii TaxID=1744 RepID=UPI0038543A20